VLHVHPVIIMLVLVLGSELAGFWGIILGPPLVVAAMGVINYFREIWGDATPKHEAEPEENEAEQPAIEEEEPGEKDAANS
jgi:predicted PurR-regulated permease PerM